jgi:hypothetical protein
MPRKGKLIMGLTDIIPAPYRWLALVAAFAVTFAAGSVAGFRIEQDHRDAKDAKQVQQQLQAQIAATQHTLDNEHRKTAAVQEIVHDVRQQSEHYQADADRNRAAGEQLRSQLAGAACARVAQPAAAGGGQAADAAASVLADVQRRLAQAEDRTVEFADASRRAGLACERSYEAVSPQDH